VAKAPAAKAPAATGASTTAPKAPRKPAAKATDAAAEATPEIPAVPAAPAAAEPAIAAPVPAYAAPAVDPVAAPPAPRKRKIWPFVLGGAILVFILAVVGIVFAILTVAGAFTDGPRETVLQYDRAFETADCDLFQKTLSQNYEDTAFGGSLDCDAWVANAKTYTVDGVYAFTVVVKSTTVDGNDAQVVTHETQAAGGAPQEFDVRYYLVKEDGSWVIDGIADETE
jgi:hypothetical protein